MPQKSKRRLPTPSPRKRRPVQCTPSDSEEFEIECDELYPPQRKTGLPACSSITSMIVPSTQYLCKIDPDGIMSLIDLKTGQLSVIQHSSTSV